MKGGKKAGAGRMWDTTHKREVKNEFRQEGATEGTKVVKKRIKWKKGRKEGKEGGHFFTEAPMIGEGPPLGLTVRVNSSAHWGRRRSPGTLDHERGGRSTAAHRGRTIRVTCY